MVSLNSRQCAQARPGFLWNSERVDLKIVTKAILNSCQIGELVQLKRVWIPLNLNESDYSYSVHGVGTSLNLWCAVYCLQNNPQILNVWKMSKKYFHTNHWIWLNWAKLDVDLQNLWFCASFSLTNAQNLRWKSICGIPCLSLRWMFADRKNSAFTELLPSHHCVQQRYLAGCVSPQGKCSSLLHNQNAQRGTTNFA